MVSLNQLKPSSVTCADSGSELNMKKKLNLDEKQANLAGCRAGHDNLGKAYPREQQTHRGEALPRSSHGYHRSRREAQDEYLV